MAISKKPKIIFFVIRSTVVSVILWLYFFFDASKNHFFPSCPFHTYTHLYCPGCGSQRSLSALLHGNLWRALSFNLLFIISLPLLIYSAIIYTINTFSVNIIQQKLVYSPLFIRLCLWFIIGFFILRNLPFVPFSFLRPE